MPNEPYNPSVRLLLCHGTRLKSWNIPNLSAPHWRLYWNEGKGAEISWEGRVVKLAPDCLVLIAPDTPFASRSSAPVGHLFIHFLAGGQFGSMRPGIFQFPAAGETRQAARNLFDLSFEAQEASLPRQLAAYSLIYACLALIPRDQIPKPILDPRVTRVMERLDREQGTVLSNRVLARLAGLEETAFIRMFKSRLGVSPQAYSRNKRVEYACDLLLHHDASIEAVAERAGFADRYHFSRVFKKVRGISPAQFRKLAYFSPAAKKRG
jgi:AraC-like DNA-binding protein